MTLPLQRIEQYSRDPSGFLFQIDGIYHRAVEKSYLEHLHHTHASGLYDELANEGILLPYSTSDVCSGSPDHPKVLLPEQLTFVSNPCEWSFSQLKEAALTTLRIQEIALGHNATLKDATPHNIQLHQGQPKLIDSLSFEKYQEGTPWQAYRQFCETFLSPLLLSSKIHPEMLSMQENMPTGIPLNLTSQLLPKRTWLNSTCLFHLHLHARASRYSENKQLKESRISVPKTSQLGLISSLTSGIRSLSPCAQKSEWSDYSSTCSYTGHASEIKRSSIEKWTKEIQPRTAWDLGANTGEYSLLLQKEGTEVISTDIDFLCVDRLYQHIRSSNRSGIHPIWSNMANPTPATGWMNTERKALLERGGRRDLVLALAFIHHLAIGKNISIPELRDLFQKIGRWLIVEFVPKEDPQSQRLLRTRTDIFERYSEESFLRIFDGAFTRASSCKVADTGRTLHLFRSND